MDFNNTFFNDSGFSVSSPHGPMPVLIISPLSCLSLTEVHVWNIGVRNNELKLKNVSPLNLQQKLRHISETPFHYGLKQNQSEYRYTYSPRMKNMESLYWIFKYTVFK